MSEDDDKTVLRRPKSQPDTPKVPPIEVSFSTADSGKQTLRFTRGFHIGRDDSCEVQIQDDRVSRKHVEIRFQDNGWWVRDLDSANGTYLNGQSVQKGALTEGSYVQLGHDGPMITFGSQAQDRTRIVKQSELIAEVSKRYLDPSYSGDMGERTQLLRRIIQQSSKSQSRRYWAIIGCVALMLAVALGVVAYQQLRLEKIKELSVDIFYNMKELELQIAGLGERVRATGSSVLIAEISSKREKLREMEDRYNTFLHEIGVISASMSEEDKAIFYIARAFGECEINMPPGFVSKVKEYIEKWKSTKRLPNAIAHAERNAYPPVVLRALAQQQLPAQFFYLALQESNYNNVKAIGPQTRYGIAKGIWQFIPATGKRYGLRTGPLAHVRRYDPQDDRFNFQKATGAASRYLKDIYKTEAQASGLLVIASYNWGENRIRKRIRKMPDNPRDRNFWQLLKKHKIPQETYDYVFYIFSAAVIGENPKLFGFDFANPLQKAEAAAG